MNGKIVQYRFFLFIYSEHTNHHQIVKIGSIGISHLDGSPQDVHIHIYKIMTIDDIITIWCFWKFLNRNIIASIKGDVYKNTCHKNDNLVNMVTHSYHGHQENKLLYVFNALITGLGNSLYIR